MQSGSSTYSSAQMKERDKRVEDRHQKELGALERKIEVIKRGSDDIRRQLYEAVNRSEHLARNLGFENLVDAEQSVDLLGEGTTYKQCAERVHVLEARLRSSESQTERAFSVVEQLEEQLLQSTRQAEAVQEQLDKEREDHLYSKSAHASLLVKFSELEDKYKRAGERYKRDYAHWKTFRKWSEEEDRIRRQARMKVSSQTERRSIDVAYFDKRAEKLKEMELHESDESDAAAETPRPQQKNPSTVPSSAKTLVPSEPPTRPLNPIPKPDFAVDHSSDTEDESQYPGNWGAPPTIPKPVFKLPLIPAHVAHSSDTEEESQSLSQQMQAFKKLRPSTAVSVKDEDEDEHIPRSSDTEDDGEPLLPPVSQTKQPLTSSSGSNTNANANVRQFVPEKSMTTPQTGKPRRRNLEVTQSERPAKMRRVCGADEDDDDVTPKRADENARPRAAPLTEPPRMQTFKGPIGRLMAEKTSSTKGKGRYAPRASDPGPGPSKPTGTTINSLFAIDASKNGGLDFQFDEVVRVRDARKGLHSGDCECCEEYYKAIGPLPQRDMGPLWRSPSNTPKRSRGCQHHDGTTSEPDTPTRTKEIEKHKKNISRHRATWTRAKTPPGYWNIGFPDTQEVGRINERAAEMHKSKLKGVEKEVERGVGRYKKR